MAAPVADVDHARGTLRGPLRGGLRAVLLGILRPLLGVRIEGLANVPTGGGVLMVANHLHNADPILLQIAAPRPIHFMAKRELFGLPLIGAVIRRVGAFPVDRGRADRGALRAAESRLAQGVAVGMFPEGTRSRERRLQPALPGAALVALRAGVPILPVAITGSERLPGNGAKGRAGGGRGGVVIRFGAPVVLGGERGAGSGRSRVEEATRQMMLAIAALLPGEYRGVYGEAGDDDEGGVAGADGMAESGGEGGG